MTIQVPYKWQPRPYQMPLWEYLEKGGRRASICWHRRAGKDNLSINWIAREMVMNPGLYWHILPTYTQGRKIVWDGFAKDGRKYLDYFPESLVKRRRDDQMLLELKPTNNAPSGSIYQVVGSDNIDRLVGSNPRGLVFSEYALQDPNAWAFLSPILAENGGWAIFISTFRGHNHFWEQHKMAEESPDWFSQTLTVDDTYKYDKNGERVPIITPDEIQALRDGGMAEARIDEEFYCKPDAGQEHAYFQDLMTAVRLEDRQGPMYRWDPDHRVNTAWDLGYNDQTAIWFFQLIGPEIRIIDHYENKGKGLPHYINIVNSKEYVYNKHLAPHDIGHTELGSGMTRIETAKNLGLRFATVPKVSIPDKINAARQILPRCTFNTKNCERGMNALRSWGRKWNEKLRRYDNKPLHDWASDSADAFCTLGVGLKMVMKLNVKGKMPGLAKQSYDILASANKRGQSGKAKTGYDIFR